MNLTSSDSLKDILITIKEELSKYEGMTRIDIFNKCVNDKLKETLYRYDVETDQVSDYLLKQHGMRVLKAITKIQKFDDRKVIYEHMKGDSDD